MAFSISEREVQGVTILDLQGRLVLEDGVPLFVERMNLLIRHAQKRMILLNFQDVSYLDSAGVGAIAWKYATALKQDGHVKLVNLRRKTHNVLNTTRLLTVMQSFDSEQEALDSFSAQEDDEDVNPIFT